MDQLCRAGYPQLHRHNRYGIYQRHIFPDTQKFLFQGAFLFVAVAQIATQIAAGIHRQFLDGTDDGNALLHLHLVNGHVGFSEGVPFQRPDAQVRHLLCLCSKFLRLPGADFPTEEGGKGGIEILTGNVPQAAAVFRWISKILSFTGTRRLLGLIFVALSERYRSTMTVIRSVWNNRPAWPNH